MITHSVKEAIKYLKSGDIIHYYCEGPGIPIQIKIVHIMSILPNEIHFSFTRNNKEVFTKLEVKDDLTDIKHVFYN